MVLRVSIQLTPLQFYYSLQTESQCAAAAAAAAAAVVKETAEERSSDSSALSSHRPGKIQASRGHLASQHWKRRRSVATSDSKVVKTGSEESVSSKLQKRKQVLSKTRPRSRDEGDSATTKDSKDSSAVQGQVIKRDDQQKCDGGNVGEVDETERTVGAASERDCCGDGKDNGCSTQAPDTAVRPIKDAMNNTKSAECRVVGEDYRECSESSTLKCLQPTLPASTPAAVSKLKIFKCSESKKLCVRSADVAEPPVEQSPPPAAAVPRPASLVHVQVQKRVDDKRERRRHRRRRRDQTKTVLAPKTIVNETTTMSDVDAALSPLSSLPDATEDVPADRPTDSVGKQQIGSAASSPLSSSDNVVSSSTSSRLLPDDEDDDDVDAARRLAAKSRSRRMAGDDENIADEGKIVEHAAADDVVDDTGKSATTLRVPIRLGGQIGQTGELLLRLPQNVSVQCSFRADQILIASSPATTSSEQSTVATDAGVAATASSDAQLLTSQQHVSYTYSSYPSARFVYLYLICRP